jgi:hypothetical protein
VNPHCRIGRVKLRGSNVSLLRPRFEGETCQSFRDSAATIAGFYPENMAGYVIVAWNGDGYWARGVRLHKDSPLGTTMLPSFVADILRRDVAADVTREVLRGEA